MDKYTVTGMSCAACAAKVEKAVRNVSGVTQCSVSLLTSAMSVEGGNSSDIISAVHKAGYGAKIYDKNSVRDRESALSEKTDTIAVKRLAVSVVLLIILMYITTGVNVLKFPLPSFMTVYPLLPAFLSALLAMTIGVLNRGFFIRGVKGLMKFSPNMDTLVALGAAVSFIWSVFVLIKTAAGLKNGDAGAMELYAKNLYFNSCGMILTFISIGKTLEAKAKRKTGDALRGLIGLSPETAVIIENDTEKTFSVSEIKPGMSVKVRAGDSIPVDGEVISGSCVVSEAMLTGECMPVTKDKGARVYAGTINRSGAAVIHAAVTPDETVLAGIIKRVEQTALSKAPVQRAADKAAAVFVPAVIAASVVTFALNLLFGVDFPAAVQRAVSVLVVSCPCSLGLATPVAVMTGSGAAAKRGILFRDAGALEAAGRVTAVAIDKTGTLTEGKPTVSGIFPYGKTERNELLSFAAYLESLSSHPLAVAVTEKCSKMKISFPSADSGEEIPGKGIKTKIGGTDLRAGSEAFISEICSVPDDKPEIPDGCSVVHFSSGKRYLGCITFEDALRPGAKNAVSRLKKLCHRVIMLTGDREKAAESAALKLGITEYRAHMLPSDKADAILKIGETEKIAMAGDGINDAPALSEAYLGLAFASGSDIASDCSDVILLDTSVFGIVNALAIGRKTLSVIRENLFWALFYNAVCIPVAAGALSFAGITLTPGLSALAMSLSSFTVVMNALRLNLCKFETKGNKTMTVEMKIKGMMCPHCEASVKKALESVEGVIEAVPDHKKNRAVLTLSREIPQEVLFAAVSEAGFEPVNIKIQ